MSVIRDKMSKESLIELLNQSVQSTGGTVVNYEALRLLLHSLVNRISEREIADASSAPAPDTSERVPRGTSILQDLIKENQELKKETNDLKREVETLRNQCVTLEDMQAALAIERHKLLKELKDTTAVPVPVSVTKVDELQEMHNSLEVRVERLEESSGVVEELSKFEVTARHGSDIISESEQQLHLQTADLRNGVQKLEEEVQKVKQELLVIIKEQKGSLEKEMQDKLDSLQSIQDNLSLKTSELYQCFENLQSIITGIANEKILQLKSECEKLHSTTTQLIEEQKQQQNHTKDLYRNMKELDKMKADKKEMKRVDDFKGDMQTLESKVLMCDTAAEKLNRMIQDLVGNICDHEENCRRINEKFCRELDCKINNSELDRLYRQVEDCKMRLLQLDTLASGSYDAAVVRKYCLPKYNCLSCDCPVNMRGTCLTTLPKAPNFPSTKCNFKRRLRQWTSLEQTEKSLTERCMEQTRERGSCGFDAQIHKEYKYTSYVKTAEASMLFKEGYCKNMDKTSSGRKPKGVQPFREQHPKTDVLCTGSSCLGSNEHWFPEDSLPKIPQSRQLRSSVPSAKKI